MDPEATADGYFLLKIKLQRWLEILRLAASVVSNLVYSVLHFINFSPPLASVSFVTLYHVCNITIN
jgi:hypothetical protein